MDKKKVFVSFDFENDANHRHILDALCQNDDLEILFEDKGVKKINEWDIEPLQINILKKIEEATHSLIIIGKNANTRHKYEKLIGKRNWINYEINKSKLSGNKVVAVKLNTYYTSPPELFRGEEVTWAKDTSVESIVEALNEA